MDPFLVLQLFTSPLISLTRRGFWQFTKLHSQTPSLSVCCVRAVPAPGLQGEWTGKPPDAIPASWSSILQAEESNSGPGRKETRGRFTFSETGKSRAERDLGTEAACGKGKPLTPGRLSSPHRRRWQERPLAATPGLDLPVLVQVAWKRSHRPCPEAALWSTGVTPSHLHDPASRRWCRFGRPLWALVARTSPQQTPTSCSVPWVRGQCLPPAG